MPIRMSGLASGMDTDSIVQALMTAKKQKKVKIEAKKTKLEWKQTIWSSLNTKLYNFYKDYTGKLRFQSNFQTKKATSSDTSKVTATAGNGATKGSHTIKVNKLAQAQQVTGAKLGQYTTTVKDKDGVEQTVQNNVSGSTKLTDLGFAKGGSQIQITVGSKNVSINVDENTTVNTFVADLQNAGLNASFDAKQGRFFISAKESGKDNGFTLVSSTLNANQQNALADLKEAAGYSGMSSEQRERLNTVLNNLQNTTGVAADKATAAATTLTEIADANAKSVITKYYQDKKIKELTEKYLEDDGNGGQRITADGMAAMKEAKLLKEGKDNFADYTAEEQKELVMKAQGLVTTKTNAYMKEEDTKQMISDAVDDNASYDFTDDDGNVLVKNKAQRDADIYNTVTSYENEIIKGTAIDADAASALKNLGLANIYNGTAVEEQKDASGNALNSMVVVAAEDSEIQLDGATMTGSSTTMEVNGMTLNLVGVTDSAITVTVENDTSAVYDSIKEFINQYNSILAEMNKYYYASSAKDYDVLTDEEKEAMSDDEVEKWETKIKDSLLRRDSTLNGILQTMRSSMTNTVITASNGKRYSLANIGITTGTDYKEYGLLHIKGDEDDEEYSDSANTLMNLLKEDPDVVAEVLSGITTQLYNNLQQKMKSSTLSSALTFYNDKEMNSQLSRYKESISDWETKLADMEQRYYKQFTAMETAMSKLNSQQDMFSQYLGS